MTTIKNASIGLGAAIVLTFGYPAHAACQTELLELPVKIVGSRAVATVGINGTPVPLTVDTGAFFSVLTEAAATQLNLNLRPLHGILIQGITGPVESRITTVDKLQLLKGEVPRVQFIVGGNEPGAGTMGLMGRNFLSITDTEYDLANGVIRLSFPNDNCAKSNMAYWAGASHVTELGLERDYHDPSPAPAMRATVKLNGRELIALFDTGATTIVSLQAARRAGVTEEQMSAAGAVYGAGRGSARGWTAPFERVEIGDETITQNRLHVGSFKLDGADLLLGIDFFLSHRIYVSRKQEKMFITYNGGTVFATNRVAAVGAAPSQAEPAATSGQPARVDEPATADLSARRAAASAARQDYERALREINRAIELEPTSAAYLTQRAGVYQALKLAAKAMADLDKAIELDPAQPDARLGRAVLRLRGKDRSGALSDLDALDKALASQAQVRLAMARLYLELEQPAEAVAQFNHWLPAHRDEARRDVALNGRCWARAMLGSELDKALADCDEAISAEPKNAAYLDSRGWVNLRLGRYEQALADFDRALLLRPGTAWTLYGRGVTRSRLGDATLGEADLVAARKAQADVDVRVTRAGLITAEAPKQ